MLLQAQSRIQHGARPPTAMEKPAIERKQQVKPEFNFAPLVQVVCIAAIFEIPSLFSFGWTNSKKIPL